MKFQLGISFPKARQNALIKFLNKLNDDEYIKAILEPNNILGIEYIKAIKKHRSRIIPVAIQRKNSGHLNSEYTGTLTSSTAIRNMICSGNTRHLKNSLTPVSYTILKEEINEGHFVSSMSEFEKIIVYKLRMQSTDMLKKLPDVSEGLENAIKKAANSYNTVGEIVDAVSSKRYPRTRIQRILLYSLLDITQKEMNIAKKITPYVRVLGFNENGKKLLGEISKKNPKVKIITSVKKFIDENTNKNFQMLLNKDILATNVYTLGFLKDSVCNLDFTKKIIEC